MKTSDKIRTLLYSLVPFLIISATAFSQEHNCDSLWNQHSAIEVDSLFWLGTTEYPGPIGGLESLMRNVVYPQRAAEDSTEGQVIIKFILSQNGEVLCPKVEKSVRSDLDSAAIEAIYKTEWELAWSQGYPVTTTVLVPITFRLHRPNQSKGVENQSKWRKLLEKLKSPNKRL